MSPEIVSKVTPFILTREKAGGGFGATPKLPATVEDTYYALRALRLMGYKSNHQATKEWLKRQLFERMGLASITFMAAWALKALEEPLPAELKAFLIQRPQTEPISTEVIYLIRLAKIIGHAPGLLKELKEKALKIKVSVVRDLYLLTWTQDPEELYGYLDWIIDSQNPDGGFGFHPGTTSFLENTYFAFRTLEYLSQGPRNPKALKAYVLSCQRGNGGFARAPGGISFLETTWYGLYLLNRLEGIDS
ncbi:prenyltransferase/squalene oxidase repeat-containing protein [Thermosulfuriphilus sp.]